MKKASDFGFAPGGAPSANSAALNAAVQGGGTVWVDGVGIADVCDPVVLGDHTTLIFENGLHLRRNPSADGKNGYVFVNEGAFSGRTNHHIRLHGLSLICNGVMCSSGGVQTDRCVPGLRGMLAFYRVADLAITDFETFDLPAQDFAIHVCTFEDLRVENVRIEGRKDGVHLGRGKRFVIRHGLFRTFDDPIALNAHDYASSNPELGWIEDGRIEDCYDLNDRDTTGYFCRILAGSWVDWFPGMQVQHSDTVVHNHRIYRVYMKPDGTVYTSTTPPTHTHGTAKLDGIRWVMVQTGDAHSCGCRNIHFSDIYLEKDRGTAFSIHFDKDKWSRSVYPYSEMPVQSGITFEDIHISGHIPTFLHARTPVDAVRLVRTELGGSTITLCDIETPGTSYVPTAVTLDGCTVQPGARPLLEVTGQRAATIRAAHTTVLPSDVPVQVSGAVTVGENDLGLAQTVG